MNENKVIVWLYVLVTTGIAVFATAFHMILEKYYIEYDTGMYKVGTYTPDSFDVFMIVGVIVIIAFLFFFRKDSLPKGLYALPVATSAISVLAATALVFSAVTFFMGGKEGLLTSTAEIVRKVNNIGSVIAFPAGLYYFVLVFLGKNATKTLCAFSFFPMIWTLVHLLGVYFDHTAQMSSPLRVIRELALIMLLLYQLMETRALLGRSKPMIQLLVSGLAIIFLTPAFLPDIFAWIGGSQLDLQNVYSLYGGIMAFYIFSRLLGSAIKCGDGQKKAKKRKTGKNDIFSEEEPEQQEFTEQLDEASAVFEADESAEDTETAVEE